MKQVRIKTNTANIMDKWLTKSVLNNFKKDETKSTILYCVLIDIKSNYYILYNFDNFLYAKSLTRVIVEVGQLHTSRFVRILSQKSAT